MILTRKYGKKLMEAILLLALLVIGATCSGDGDDREVGRIEWRTASMVGAASGSATLQVTGEAGTAWTIEIVEGADWCSFDLEDYVGATLRTGVIDPSAARNIFYLYYKDNQTGEARTATLAWSIDGSSMQHQLTLKQMPSSASNDPYVEGHAGFWPELPEKIEQKDYIYVTHYASLRGATVRNYSLCYDTERHVAGWVAYPLHTVYRGSASRSDDFGYDPKIPFEDQPNLAAGSYRGYYDRGHQCPSADRTANDELNHQTFYASNMTPQIGSLNQRFWADIEASVRRNMCSDTLYVVTGCYYADESTSTYDRDGMLCPVPTNYYKVLLRTKSGTTGKKIRDCSPSELKAIGFWVEARSYDEGTPVASVARSVAEIERQTGFDFFPQVADEVKQQYNPSQWSL